MGENKPALREASVEENTKLSQVEELTNICIKPIYSIVQKRAESSIR